MEQSELFNINLDEYSFDNYEKIKKLQESKEQSDFLKILNFHKKKIHSILYEEDKTIKIDDIKIEKIYPYINLCSLIEDNLNIVNYEYEFELINKIYTEQTKEKNEHLKIIISKLINILINNFKGIKKINIDNMKKIEDSNKKVIKDNIKTLKKYNLNENDIYQKHIEDIYLEIIKTLIKDQKLDKIENIMIELEFGSIPFNNIINELNKIIDKK